MLRFLRFVVLVALSSGTAGLAYLTLQQAAIPGASNIATGLAAAGIGLVSGLTVAWVRGIPWDLVYGQLQIWRTHFAMQCTWATVACAALAVLVYY